MENMSLSYMLKTNITKVEDYEEWKLIRGFYKELLCTFNKCKMIMDL